MTQSDPLDGVTDQPTTTFAGGLPPRRPHVDPSKAAEAYGEAAEGHEAPASPDAAGQDGNVDPSDEPVEHDGLPEGHEATREELQQRLEEAEKALAIVEAERDEHLGDLQRKAAELSNVLKREERNAQTGRIEGRIEVMRSLLDVLDDFDRTMEAVAKSEDEGLRSGVAMVHDKLRSVLAQHGLTRVGEVGEPFDPTAKHEAVHQVEAEDGPLDEPVVAEVYRPGYVVGERVVRAAMVVVKQ